MSIFTFQNVCINCANMFFSLVIEWLHTKLNNCEITAKSSSNCGVQSEVTDTTKNANKIGGKFSTSTPASVESVWLLKNCVLKILIYFNVFSRMIISLNLIIRNLT